MGISRLLAKGWVVFCLLAGLYALAANAADGHSTAAFLPTVIVTVLLFGAMGLLFVAGFGAAPGGISARSLIERLTPHHFLPGFNELVWIGFAVLSFVVQTIYLPWHVEGGLLGALQTAVNFAVPGSNQLFYGLAACGLDGGRMFASAFAWLLAFIFLGSSLSRVRLQAGILRLERKARPEPLTPTGTALLLGILAVGGIQLLYVGSLYPLLPCSVVQSVIGDMLVGEAPLMLAYLILAALTHLIALGNEA